MIKRREPLTLTNIEDIAKAYSKADTEAKGYLATDMMKKAEEARMNSSSAAAAVG